MSQSGQSPRDPTAASRCFRNRYPVKTTTDKARSSACRISHDAVARCCAVRIPRLREHPGVSTSLLHLAERRMTLECAAVGDMVVGRRNVALCRTRRTSRLHRGACGSDSSHPPSDRRGRLLMARDGVDARAFQAVFFLFGHTRATTRGTRPAPRGARRPPRSQPLSRVGLHERERKAREAT
jgi:hypothetical protein